MPRTQQIRTAAIRFTAFFLFLICLMAKADPLAAQAVHLNGVTAVGSSAPSTTVTLSLPKGGTINAVKLFGQGSPNVDFVNAGGTCVANATFLANQSCTVNVVFTPSSPGQRRGAVVLLDSSHSVLASQLITGSATGSVGVFVPGTITTVAGDSTWLYAGDGFAATASSIFLPFGIAVDGQGDLFIADSSNNRIRRVDAATTIMSTIAGNGIIGSTGENGPATAATLNNPTSVALDPAGNVYFADSGNNLIRRIDAFTGIINIVAGTTGRHGYTGDNGPATSATFNSPNGLSFDANGNLFVADSGNHVIRMIDTSGIITTVAGTGVAGYNGDGVAATSAQLNAPWSATPASGGGFYIADQQNHRIRFVNASGTISTVVGTGVAGFYGDTGPANLAQLNVPASVLVDVAGNLYIADAGNNRVRRVNANTNVIDTFAGTASESFSGDNGPANAAGLYGPYAFALDTKGNIFIADVFHNRIREVAANTALLQFPVMRVGRVSAPLTQTLENDGNAPLNISKFNPVLNSQLDAGTTTCSLTTPLPSLSQCVIGVDFAPTTIGKLVSGELDADSDAGNSPGVIDLTAQVLDVDPTQITLTSSLNPSTTGAAVTFTATVTSTGTTPTGPITLLDGTTTIGTSTLGSGGVGTFTLSNLTSGSHNLTVSYAGDSQNAASVSSVLVQVVKDQVAATTTTLSSAATPTIAGAAATFTANVSIVTPNSGNGPITGSVAFKLGANTLGVANIAAGSTPSLGTATIALTNLPVGTDSVIAVYSGSSSYQTSTSTPFVQTVNLATTQTALTSAANPSPAGAPVSLTATLTSNGGVPTGSVNFLDGSKSLGSASLNKTGAAVLSVPGVNWSVGTHTLTAVYAGDSNDGGSTSPALPEVINIASSNTTVTSSLNPSGLGAAVTFTASVGSTGGTPTGSVQFLDGSTVLGSANLNAAGASATATFAVSTLAIGTHPITVAYSGDSFDSPSTSPALNQIVQTATIAATLKTSANPAIFQAPLTLTAAVTGSGSTPTGTMTLLDGATTIATQPVPANGVVAFVNPTLAIGSHTLTAAYSGDTNHAAVTSAAVNQVIQQSTKTVLTSSATSQVAGKSLTFTATVTGASGLAFTGPIAFTDGGALIANVAPDATGVANLTTSGLIPGHHLIAAAYAGDTLDAASSSAVIDITVTLATTSTTLSTSANPINSGASLTLSSTVTGNGGTPTGSVTFHDGGTVLTQVQLTSSATATFSISTLTPGIHQLYATYSGDTLDGSSTSPTTSQQVAQKTGVTLTSATNPSLLQDNVVLSIVISNGSAATPTGSVTLTDGGNTIATLVLNAAGTASYTLQSPAVGVHTLVANYAGDSQNAPAASAPLVQNVTLRPSSTSFDPSATAISSGQQITLISVVQASGSRPATGTVTFVSGTTVLGVAPIDATGLATLNVTPAQGTWNTVAKYSGDSLYAASVSKPTSIVVGPTTEFTINLTPATLSMASGSHGSLNINIATASTFSDTLAMGCAGLPADATCTFSNDQVKAGGGAPITLSVIVDTGNPLGAGATASLHNPLDANRISNTEACALPAGILLALLLGFNRRRLSRINPRLALFSLILLLGAGSAVLSGCGSTLNVTDTPAGSYTFQIVATGAHTAVTQTATVQLTVTK